MSYQSTEGNIIKIRFKIIPLRIDHDDLTTYKAVALPVAETGLVNESAIPIEINLNDKTQPKWLGHRVTPTNEQFKEAIVNSKHVIGRTVEEVELITQHIITKPTYKVIEATELKSELCAKGEPQ